MDHQKELDWTTCSILIDWLIQVQVHFRLMPETLFFAVNLINCFLSTRVISLAKLQLVSITCLFITSKVNKIELPLIIHFLHQCSNSSYTENGIFQVERYILKMLEWDFSYPNHIHFL